jgi:hypothetical protein
MTGSSLNLRGRRGLLVKRASKPIEGVFVFIVALQLNTELSAYPEMDES